MKTWGAPRKGQFLLISSIVLGLMLITAASTISQTKSREYRQEPDEYNAHLIKQEAEKIDMSNSHERKEFDKLTDMVTNYRSTTRYWRTQNCFNITLQNPRTLMRLHAPESFCP